MVCINQVRQDKSSFRKILSVCEQTIPQSLLPTWKKKKKEGVFLQMSPGYCQDRNR